MSFSYMYTSYWFNCIQRSRIFNSQRFRNWIFYIYSSLQLNFVYYLYIFARAEEKEERLRSLMTGQKRKQTGVKHFDRWSISFLFFFRRRRPFTYVVRSYLFLTRASMPQGHIISNIIIVDYLILFFRT
jgi:hypothetical protein